MAFSFKQAISTGISKLFGMDGYDPYNPFWGDTGGYSALPIKSPNQWLSLKNTNPRMSPIEKLSNDMAAVKWKHMIDGEEYEESPVIELLNNPTQVPGFSGYMNMKLSQQYAEILGEWFWLITERDNKGNPTQLTVIPPTWVTKVATKPEDKYVVNGMNSMVFEVDYEDMIYFKDPNIVNPYRRGIGQVQAIGDEIDTDEQMAKFSKKVFHQGAMPPMAIGLKTGQTGTHAKDTLERAKASWMEKHSSIKNAYVPAFFNAESMDIKVLRQTMAELDYIASRKFIRDMTLEHWGIPKELMGIVENSNRSTIAVAQTIYAQNQLVPRLEMLTPVLNNQLLTQFNLPGELVPEEVIPVDKEFVSEQASKDWDGGLITRNEARELKGYDTTKDGDVYKQGISTVMVPQRKEGESDPVKTIGDVEGDDVIEIDFNDGDTKRVKKFEDEVRERVWKAVDDAAIAGENSFIRDLKKYFQNQQNEISRAISSAAKQLNKALTEEGAQEAVDTFFDEEDEVLLAVMTPHWVDSALRGFTVSNDAFQFGLSWDVVRDEFLVGINEYGLDRAKLINDTTKEALRKQISEGISEGDSIPQIRDRITEVYQDAKDRRATVIARTETHNSTVAGSFETYKSAGVQQKEWLTTIDGREREWHGSMDGQIRNIDEPFVSGQGNELMHPGDPNSGVANEVIQCRCALLPVIEI